MVQCEFKMLNVFYNKFHKSMRSVKQPLKRNSHKLLVPDMWEVLIVKHPSEENAIIAGSSCLNS